MTQSLDLSPYTLLIATPVMDGKRDDAYTDSYDRTKELIQAHGGRVAKLTHRYCADIYLARARLLGAFIRNKEATHMMFIDADQGWNAEDVARMLWLKRDFLGAVSCKKQYPLNFAFALHDDYSRPLPMYHELGTNVAEVSEIGAAFLMITRACAERITSAHPELEFDGEENITEWAVFDPIIINKGLEYPRRRLSEDYSFCYRWRALGGKVEVLLDVTLDHVGAHKFSGNLLEHLIKSDPNFNAEDELVA